MIDGIYTNLDAEGGRDVRQFVEALFGFNKPSSTPIHDVVLVVIGQPGHDLQPVPPEFDFMATIDVGELLPITLSGKREDPDNPGQFLPGELLGTPTMTIQDGAVIEMVEDTDENPSTFKVRGKAQGSSTVTATVGTLTAVGLVVVNDPADDATILEMEFGEPEAAPA